MSSLAVSDRQPCLEQGGEAIRASGGPDVIKHAHATRVRKGLAKQRGSLGRVLVFR